MAKSARKIKFTDKYIDPRSVTMEQIDAAIGERNVYAALLKTMVWRGGFNKGLATTGPMLEVIKPFAQHPIALAAAGIFYHMEERPRSEVVQLITPRIAKRVLQMAAQGNHYAQFHGALLARIGLGMEYDFNLAEKLYLAAIKSGDAVASLHLAAMRVIQIGEIEKILASDALAQGRGGPNEWDRERLISQRTEWREDIGRLYRYAADGGVATGQQRVAPLYLGSDPPASLVKGLTEEERVQKAIYYYELAWRQDQVDAKICQAELYARLNRNDEAISAYREILATANRRQDDPAPAQVALGQLYDKLGQHEEALRLYQSAADRCYLPATIEMAARYHSGEKGVTKNFMTALQWHRLARDIQATGQQALEQTDEHKLLAVEAGFFGEAPDTAPKIWLPSGGGNNFLIPATRDVLKAGLDLSVAKLLPTDWAEALAWLETEAQKGSPQATTIAAKLFMLQGNGDKSQAMLTLASERDNNAAAKLELAEGFFTDYEYPEDATFALVQVTRLNRSDLSESQQGRLDQLQAAMWREAWIETEFEVLLPAALSGHKELANLPPSTICFFPLNGLGLSGLSDYENTSFYAAFEIAKRFAKGDGVTIDRTEAFRRLSNLLIDPTIIPHSEDHSIGMLPLHHPVRPIAQRLWDQLAATIITKTDQTTHMVEAFDPSSLEDTAPYVFARNHEPTFKSMQKYALKRLARS